MKRLISAILLGYCALWGENVLTNQLGTAVPAMDWTTMSVNGLTGLKSLGYLTGFTKASYVPARHDYVVLGENWATSSEPNCAWDSYNFTESRWYISSLEG